MRRSAVVIAFVALCAFVPLEGPLLDDVDERGIFVMETADTAEARRWCNTDPEVRAGRLRAEIHPWLVARGVVPGH